MDMQATAHVDDVLAVEIEDKPGSLAAILKPLKDANINVRYMYAFIGLSSNKAVMIFKFSDNDRAIKLMQEIGVNIIDAETFGILETGNNGQQ